MSSLANGGIHDGAGYSPLRRIVSLALVLCWLGLFAATHWPGEHQPAPPPWDKVAHFVSYLVLALLFAIWAMGRTGRGAIRFVGMLLVLAAFAAFDELTQPLVGRHADWFDWYADVAGIACGLVIAAVGGARFRSRGREMAARRADIG